MNHPRLSLSIANFFGAGHYFLFIYVVAPYLSELMPEDSVGLVISFGALLTLLAFPFMPRITARFGPRKTAMVLAGLQAFAVLWLSGEPSVVPAVLMVAIAAAISPLIAFQLDLLLEATMREGTDTGRVRSAFMTAGSLALVLTPIIIGVLLATTDAYGRVFAVAAAALLPFIGILLIAKLPYAPSLSLSDIRAAAGCVLKDPDLAAITIAGFVLQFFYHLAALYIPLYLHVALDIPWSDLGWMFALMLIPFVLLEYPASWLADTKLGDQEMMGLGFLLTGSAFATLAFVTVGSALVAITVILILSRIGAAVAEAMVEGHFFRQVSERDLHTITIFRMMRPVGALTAPIVGSMLLAVDGFSILFVVSGMLIAGVGVTASLLIQDVR